MPAFPPAGRFGCEAPGCPEDGVTDFWRHRPAVDREFLKPGDTAGDTALGLAHNMPAIDGRHDGSRLHTIGKATARMQRRGISNLNQVTA